MRANARQGVRLISERPCQGRRVISAALCLSLAVGCTYIPTTSLRYDPIEVSVPSAPSLRLAVLPLEEERGVRRYPGLQGHMFATYIPLIPYIKVPYERLDESHMLHQQNQGSVVDANEHFTIAIAKQIARDLSSSGLFADVWFASTESATSGADLVLSGSLRSTEFDVYASSYMLGAAGVLLWYLPLPVGRDKATVSMDLILRDRAGRELWSHPVSKSASKIFTMYNSTGESTSSRYRITIKRYGSNDLGIDGNSLWAYHAEAVRAAVGEAKSSMAEYLATMDDFPRVEAEP